MDGLVSGGSLDSFYPSLNFSDCPNGSLWIWNVFYECAQDGRDVASVVFGIFSLLCFMGASFPQYWQSCKAGNMDQALSIWFLLAWLAGDSCNFVGAFLAQQLPATGAHGAHLFKSALRALCRSLPHHWSMIRKDSRPLWMAWNARPWTEAGSVIEETFTAVYYVLADLVMLSLYIYFKLRNRGPRSALYAPINVLCGVALLGMGTAFSALRGPNHEALETSVSYKGRSLLSADSLGWKPFHTNEKIGCAIGSVASVLYLLSRVPQIATNFRRKSTEGVSKTLFLMVILGNLTYGLGVLLKNPEKDQSEGNYVLHHLPWLVGSLGVVCLDLFILFQFFLYRQRRSVAANLETKPLLGSQNGPIYA